LCLQRGGEHAGREGGKEGEREGRRARTCFGINQHLHLVVGHSQLANGVHVQLTDLKEEDDHRSDDTVLQALREGGGEGGAGEAHGREGWRDEGRESGTYLLNVVEDSDEEGEDHDQEVHRGHPQRPTGGGREGGRKGRKKDELFEQKDESS